MVHPVKSKFIDFKFFNFYKFFTSISYQFFGDVPAKFKDKLFIDSIEDTLLIISFITEWLRFSLLDKFKFNVWTVDII